MYHSIIINPESCTLLGSFTWGDSPVLFADDANIYFIYSWETIQIEMDKIAAWLNVNKLSINTGKTKNKKQKIIMI